LLQNCKSFLPGAEHLPDPDFIPIDRGRQPVDYMRFVIHNQQ
jgi:hypothetical protein